MIETNYSKVSKQMMKNGKLPICLFTSLDFKTYLGHKHHVTGKHKDGLKLANLTNVSRSRTWLILIINCLKIWLKLDIDGQVTGGL